jgi:hypothetical protein
VEILTKNKAQLRDALQKKNSQLDLLQVEKDELQAALERVWEVPNHSQVLARAGEKTG